MFVFKSLISIILFLILFNVDGSSIILMHLNESEASIEETLLYNGSDLGFTLEYPADWTREGDTFVSPQSSFTDQSPEVISVTREIIPTDTTLDEYSNSAINLLAEQLPNFMLQEEGYSTISGLPAYKVIYTYMEQGQEIKLMQIWTVTDRMAYALTYGGITQEFEDNMPVFLNVIDSFDIIGSREANGDDQLRNSTTGRTPTIPVF